MRKYRFRAWDKQYKCMDYDFWISSSGKIYDVAERTHDTPNQEIEEKEIDNYIIMQSTGLQDSKGVEIFEGDVLEVENEDGDMNKLIVKYGIARREMASGWEVDIPCFYFDLVGADFKAFPIVNNYAGKHDLEMLEIIGNVHTGVNNADNK